MPDDKKISTGPLSSQIARSIERLRTEKRLPYTEMSDRLTALGRPIPVLGLRRIERGERRVDIDDLAAIARALGVPPLLLIFPVDVSREVEVLPGQVRPTYAAARWFMGDSAFPAEAGSPSSYTEEDWREFAAGPTVLGSFAGHEQIAGEAEIALHGARSHRELAVRNAHVEGGPEWHHRMAEGDERRYRELERELIGIRERLRAAGIEPPPLRPALAHIDQVAGRREERHGQS